MLPYITHPIDVINRLAYVGEVKDEEILIAAALHDVLEETEVKPEEIEEKFGSATLALVKELTREEPTEKIARNLSEPALYELRNMLLLSGIRKMSPAAQVVKLADRLSNLSSAEKTRTGLKLERYRTQSRSILEIIPREINPNIWDAIDRILKGNAESPADSAPKA